MISLSTADGFNLCILLTMLAFFLAQLWYSLKDRKRYRVPTEPLLGNCPKCNIRFRVLVHKQPGRVRCPHCGTLCKRPE